MNLIKKIKIVFLSFLSLLIPVGICTWAISGVIKQEQLKAEYVVSPFTEYVLNPTKGSVIYDDTTNGSDFLGYDVSSDFTYDSTNKIVELGNPKIKGGISISNTISFAHSSNPSLNYGEDQFLNSGAFGNDGTVVTSTTQLYPNSNFSSNRLFTIKLTSDITLTNNSTLSVGALIGTNASTGSSGGVINGSFVCLDLNGHNLIINNGSTLNAYGYIIDTKLNENGKHKGSIINNGVIYTGFVVEDYYGGGLTVGRGFSSQMPFCLYSLPYLACKVVNNNGSVIKAPTMLYANSVMNKTVLNRFGNNGDYFLQSESSDSILIIDTYNNLSANGKSYAENFRSYYTFNGDFKTNSLKLTIAFEKAGIKVNATIDMSQFAFFIPPYADISLVGEGSSFDLNMLLQFLPGSSLNVNKGTTLNLTSVDYRTFIKGDGTIVGLLEKDIRKGTSSGGIIERTEMPPSINTDFAYTRNEDGTDVTNSLYYFSSSDYSKYEKMENDMLLTANSRIKLNGRLSFENRTQSMISGYIEISDDSIADLTNNLSSVNCFSHFAETFANVNGASPLIDWVTSGTWPSPISFGGYVNEPLVMANANNQTDPNLIGRVFNPQRTIDSSLSNEVYYNFRKGYFLDILTDDYFAYCLNDSIGTVVNNLSEVSVTGSLTKIEGIDNNGNAIINGNKYIYFNNSFLATNYLSDDVNNNGSGLYIKDETTGSFNRIVNGTTTYTYNAERYAVDYRGAAFVGEFEQKVSIKAEQTGTNAFLGYIWDGDLIRGSRNNLPVKTEKNEIERRTLGIETRSSKISVKNLMIPDEFDTNIDQANSILVDASHLSQSNTAYNDFTLISGSSCDLSTDNESVEPEFSDWTFNGKYLSDSDKASENGNYANAWKITSDQLGIGKARREREEYYDYYYFQFTATYVSSNFSIEGVPLYERKLSTGSAIKYDEELDLWVKA